MGENGYYYSYVQSLISCIENEDYESILEVISHDYYLGGKIVVEKICRKLPENFHNKVIMMAAVEKNPNAVNYLKKFGDKK